MVTNGDPLASEGYDMARQGPTLEDAYTEACTALGEEIVQRRLMAKQANAEVQRLTEENARLTAELRTDPSE